MVTVLKVIYVLAWLYGGKYKVWWDFVDPVVSYFGDICIRYHINIYIYVFICDDIYRYLVIDLYVYICIYIHVSHIY